MPIKNSSSIWMAKICISKKSITIKQYWHKNNSHFIDVIGHSMNPKEPESPIKKYLKILVNKCFKISTMDTTPPYLHMAKQGQESHVRLKVSQVYNPKVCYNCVFKMSSEGRNKTNQRTLQPLSEWHTWKFITKNLKISFLKIQKIMKFKWKH